MKAILIVLSIFSISLYANGQQDTSKFLGNWQLQGSSKVLVSDLAELHHKESSQDFSWEVLSPALMIMKNDVFYQKATYQISGNELIVTHTGFSLSFEIIDLTVNRLVVKDLLGSYQYYRKNH